MFYLITCADWDDIVVEAARPGGRRHLGDGFRSCTSVKCL